ncbi:MAG: ANTAR domain-containing protein [Jatrophihabitantaceae bacterium]
MSTGERWARLVALERSPATGDRQSLLRDVVALGYEVAQGVLGCSITEADQPGGRSAAVSNTLAASLDQAQFDAGDGPCLAAARTQRWHQIDAMGEDDRFPGFAGEATRWGVLSSLSLPVPGASTPTSLNMYASRPAAFADRRSRAIAGLLVRCAAALLSPQAAAADPARSVAGLDEALARSRLVTLAQQRLAVRHRITEPAAFRRLAKRTRHEQRSIFEVAREVLDGPEQEDR